MNFTDTVMEKIPVSNQVGMIDDEGNFHLWENVPDSLMKEYDRFRNVAYYTGTHFEE
jgi:hypothetical protein